MKLVTFQRNKILQLGIRTEAGVIDVAQASDGHREIPLTTDAAIRGGAQTLRVLQDLQDKFVGVYLNREGCAGIAGAVFKVQ